MSTIIIFLILMMLLVLSALWTVITSTLLMSAIGLAVTSMVLSLIMFQLDAPLAAVFELSVCAGLITVVFVSAISLTKRLHGKEEDLRRQYRARRFMWLPLIMAVLIGLLWLFRQNIEFPQTNVALDMDLRNTIWNIRRFDLLGQVIVILSGVFGVVVLFKDWATKKGAGK